MVKVQEYWIKFINIKEVVRMEIIIKCDVQEIADLVNAIQSQHKDLSVSLERNNVNQKTKDMLIKDLRNLARTTDDTCCKVVGYLQDLR